MKKRKKLGDEIYILPPHWSLYGFHCFLTTEDAFEWYGYSMPPPTVIRQYIIPKGTKVVEGRQGNYIVIITPLLINPRIGGKKI